MAPREPLARDDRLEGVRKVLAPPSIRRPAVRDRDGLQA